MCFTLSLNINPQLPLTCHTKIHQKNTRSPYPWAHFQGLSTIKNETEKLQVEGMILLNRVPQYTKKVY